MDVYPLYAQQLSRGCLIVKGLDTSVKVKDNTWSTQSRNQECSSPLKDLKDNLQWGTQNISKYFRDLFTQKSKKTSQHWLCQITAHLTIYANATFFSFFNIFDNGYSGHFRLILFYLISWSKYSFKPFSYIHYYKVVFLFYLVIYLLHKCRVWNKINISQDKVYVTSEMAKLL